MGEGGGAGDGQSRVKTSCSMCRYTQDELRFKVRWRFKTKFLQVLEVLQEIMDQL